MHLSALWWRLHVDWPPSLLQVGWPKLGAFGFRTCIHPPEVCLQSHLKTCHYNVSHTKGRRKLHTLRISGEINR